MNLTKKMTAWFLTIVMVLCMIPNAAFAQEMDASALQYEVFEEMNEEKTQVTISLQFAETESIQLEKVTLPDGSEVTENLSTVTFTTSLNGDYAFVVSYLMDGTSQEETINVNVSSLDGNTEGTDENTDGTDENQGDDLNASFVLKGATYFDGHPDPFFGGTKQYMISDKSIIPKKTIIPYNGWQLMKLTIEIPYQDGLEVTNIQPSTESVYPEYSIIERDDKESKWTYDLYFYDNGTYNFTINYSLNGEERTAEKAYTVDGLVSIKNAAMRRHLIHNYGEFSGFSHQGGQYITEEFLSRPLYDPWGNLVFDFGKDTDNGTTAQYTTSLDGLQYLTNIHGMFLYDCRNLAPGETIEPITNTYYPNMKQLRISEIFNNRPNLPEGSYTPEMIAQAISNMPNLSELSICYTGFVDLPVIGQLNGLLTTLEADHCAIESIEGIEKHTNIQKISLGINKIKSIQPFSKANLSNVNFLDLGGNQIFDLRPLYETLNPKIVGGKRFGANKQTIEYEKTVIANLKGDQYEIELPMPIDIDGTLTDTSEVKVKYNDDNSKSYKTTKKDGKTYIYIPQGDVDSDKENPFEGAEFKFSFNNNNGTDSRTKSGFNGTLVFHASPFEEKDNSYKVKYDFVSGTTDKTLPSEVTSLLPVDPTEYAEGDIINAIQPTSTSVNASGGTWTFTGYDADSKTACIDNVSEDGYIHFIGTWKFATNTGSYNTPPVIHASDKTIAISDNFDPLDGVTATDNEDGDLTDKIEIVANNVDTSKAGVYEVTYKVTDSHGYTTTKTITVTVTEKDLPVVPDKPVKPEKPEKPEKPGKPDTPIKPDKPNNPTMPDKISHDESPKTGDDANIIFWLSLLAVSSAACIGLYRKREKVK